MAVAIAPRPPPALARYTVVALALGVHPPDRSDKPSDTPLYLLLHLSNHPTWKAIFSSAARTEFDRSPIFSPARYLLLLYIQKAGSLRSLPKACLCGLHAMRGTGARGYVRTSDWLCMQETEKGAK